MPKTLKKNKKRQKPLPKPAIWITWWNRFRKGIFIVVLLAAVCFAGWFSCKGWYSSRYPKAYTDWWKATLRLEQDAREGKTEIENAQKWLVASQKLAKFSKPMKWVYNDISPEDPFIILIEMTTNYRLKPEKISSQTDEITMLHNQFSDYNRYLGRTEPVFLADRLVQEWNCLKQLIQTDAEGDKIQASIQLINLQIPLLEPFWLESDIT
ncbi:MAG: hypothetical protein PHD83_04450, partial [Caldisericia bacterium]|nr:hypothetical protein [Caldisericia bacterium]